MLSGDSSPLFLELPIGHCQEPKSEADPASEATNLLASSQHSAPPKPLHS